MREPPKLAEALIRSVLQSDYGITASSLSFLPLGNDSASSVYRIQSVDGIRYFLKARSMEEFNLPSLVIPRYLCDRGLPHVFAPLPTCQQSLWVNVGDFALSLYPFIEGADNARPSVQHWQQLGTLMNQVHTLQLPLDLEKTVPRETFVPSRRSVIDDLKVAVNRRDLRTAEEIELAEFWCNHEDTIMTVVSRSDALADQLRQVPKPLALCHADMHVWNLMIDIERNLWLVDWDEVILAPKERDLMFVIGGIGGYRPETNCFFLGYGDLPIDHVALAYYRYAWAVQDIAAFGEQVFFRPDLGEASRREALRGFIGQFSPGGIVELALASKFTGE